MTSDLAVPGAAPAAWRRPLRLALVRPKSAAASACVRAAPYLSTEGVPTPAASSQVLLMPMDVELSELTAGGLVEPNAAWTQAGAGNVAQAVAGVLNDAQRPFRDYQPDQQPAERVQIHTQVVKLHEAVGRTILTHKYRPELELPTKEGLFDWTLGEGATALRQDTDADYALFVYFRDSFSSPGRKALIFAAALFGVGVPGGVQTGFASLVDLRTGNIVWFNTHLSGEADLREAESATTSTQALLTGLPL